MSYRIVRMFQKEGQKRRVIKRGLTLEEARNWCLDPESSSSTCKKAKGQSITRAFGPWFDGYEEE